VAGWRLPETGRSQFRADCRALWFGHCRITSLLPLVLATLLAGVIDETARGAPTDKPPPASLNLDFALGAPGRAPDGWQIRGGSSEAHVSSDSTRAGARCLVLSGTAPPPNDFASARQRFDALPWRNRRVEFSARLSCRAKSGAGTGTMWLAVFGPKLRTLSYDDTSDLPVTSPGWTQARVVAEVPAEAESLSIGFLLRGSGSLWATDVGFRATGALGEGDHAPRALTARGLENLVAFTRLLGYVRHFDPADSAAATDWNAFTIAAVDTVEGAPGPAELAAILRRLFQPLDPVLRVDTRPVAIDSVALRPRGAAPTGIVSWKHVGWGSSSNLSGPYSSRRDMSSLDRTDMRPGPRRGITENLGAGVWCAVPLSLWADSSGSLPHGQAGRWTPARPRSSEFSPSGSDRSTRLADAALCWNVLQHFYPYFDVVGTDWNVALTEALRSAATDRGRADFVATLDRLSAHLDDGHSVVTGPGEEFPFAAPFAWRWVEGRLVITAVSDSAGIDLQRGDVVRSLNGEPVERRYASLATRISAASDGWRRYRSLARMASEARDTLVLDVERADGRRHRVPVPRSDDLPPGFGRPDKIAQVRPGIWYVDVGRVDDDMFMAKVDTLARARGVIFDVRGYPWRLGIEPLAGLTDTTMTCAQWHIPIVSRPDHRDMAFDFSIWKVAPRAPRFRGRIAFLIDGEAISYAETWLGIVEYYRLGALVGEPTAGTNGNVNVIRLPGGYAVRFTGMKVLKHDGSRHHGVGIHPTVPVSPTIAGVRAGRDEQLERAIEIVGG